MPDSRAHRGAHPEDARDFALAYEATLRSAVAELSYLLTRDYALGAALKLVGDRHQLTVRQRNSVARAACGDDALARRAELRQHPEALRGQRVSLDGFNCLITVEALLAGAPVFVGRDGALRDLASVHGSYRRVEETERALALLVEELCALDVAFVHVLLDRPVGNSGRVRGLFEAELTRRGLASEVRLEDRVDRALLSLALPVASSDGFLIERAPWFDLPRALALRHGLARWCLALGPRP